MKPIVLFKMGGSLAQSCACREWLAVLSLCARSYHVLVVPGGGAFAEAVRGLSASCGLSESIGHDLAVRGMEMYGYSLLALSSDFMAVSSRSAMRRCWRQGRMALWLPVAMMEREWDLPKKWSYTSDSIALWLALRLQAQALFWLKACQPQHTALSGLQQQGLIDKGVSAFKNIGDLSVYCLGPKQQQAVVSFCRRVDDNALVAVKWGMGKGVMR